MSVVVKFGAVVEYMFWCPWCWCSLLTTTTATDILIQSGKIGIEVAMPKSELDDSCKLKSVEHEEVGWRVEGGEVEMDRPVVSALSGRL